MKYKLCWLPHTFPHIPVSNVALLHTEFNPFKERLFLAHSVVTIVGVRCEYGETFPYPGCICQGSALHIQLPGILCMFSVFSKHTWFSATLANDVTPIDEEVYCLCHICMHIYAQFQVGLSCTCWVCYTCVLLPHLRGSFTKE